MTLVILTVLAVVAGPAFSDSVANSERSVASLRVYNPTAWDGPVVLEIPTGRIASPGVLDWERTRLVRDGREIPFAICEGTPHWKAKLVAPIKEPRAEDLLIFSTVAPPTTWVEIDVLSGQPIRRSALSVNRGRLTIAYPDVKAVVDEATGTLLELESSGQDILERPPAIAFHQGAGDKQRPVEPVGVSLVSSSSSAAMTELNFVLQVDDALGEMTRTKFSELDRHRRHGLKLLDYLHQRGVKVWQWIPIGAVPTTFAEKHPDAMCPGTGPSARHGFSGKHVIPCHTHAVYREFLEAYLKELLETYPIDGVVMIRDDNGGICDCPRCKEHLAQSRTKSAAWEPTATPNSFRYDWATRTFGAGHALAYVALIDAYDGLREKYNLPMHPRNWIKLGAGQQEEASRLGRQELARFQERLADLEQAVGDRSHAKWFAHVRLFGTYFEYHLRRLENFSLMRAIVAESQSALNEGLPEDSRQELIVLHQEMYDLANAYDEQAAQVPGNMMTQVRNGRMTRPFKEWVAGYDAALEWQLDTKQFAGSMQAAPGRLSAGRCPFITQNVSLAWE